MGNQDKCLNDAYGNQFVKLSEDLLLLVISRNRLKVVSEYSPREIISELFSGAKVHQIIIQDPIGLYNMLHSATMLDYRMLWYALMAAYHTAPQHRTPKHSAAQHSAAYHTTPHHTAPHHTAPHHSIPHHTTSHHTSPRHTTA